MSQPAEVDPEKRARPADPLCILELGCGVGPPGTGYVQQFFQELYGLPARLARRSGDALGRRGLPHQIPGWATREGENRSLS